MVICCCCRRFVPLYVVVCAAATTAATALQVSVVSSVAEAGVSGAASVSLVVRDGVQVLLPMSGGCLLALRPPPSLPACWP